MFFKKIFHSSWPFALFVVLLSIIYYAGIPGVPFHPDESTNLFMSKDLDLLVQQPSALFWSPDKVADPRQIYRELDAPLSRYLIGIGRWIARIPALPVDWNWSATWDENQQAGALPDAILLNTGRYAVSALFPFSLILLYFTASKIGGRFLSWSAVVFLASNALVLLHTRRAMMESGLLFSIVLFLFFLVHFQSRPWLSAIPAALAFSAKQSAGVLFLAGIAAIILLVIKKEISAKKALLYTGFSLIIFLAVVLALNPYLWGNPYLAVRDAIVSRQELLQKQVATIQSASPEMSLDDPLKRFGALVVQLFVTRPAIADVGNYLAQTAPAETIYFANPFNSLFRDLFNGSFLLILTLLGFFIGLYQLLRRTGEARDQIGLLWFAGLVQFIGLGLIVSLPFQRYCLPLVPFSCLWIAYSLDKGRQLVMLQRSRWKTRWTL
jgi:4-amino-4-deoxy-L-arabinose transferase-like glycosyltransferase